MSLDNYLYFCPVKRDGKVSDWEINLMDFHGNMRIHNWFNRFEKVNVDVLKRLSNDIDRVKKDMKFGDELFPKEGSKFDKYDVDILCDFKEKIDEIIEHRDCVGSLRYFAW